MHFYRKLVDPFTKHENQNVKMTKEMKIRHFVMTLGLPVSKCDLVGHLVWDCRLAFKRSTPPEGETTSKSLCGLHMFGTCRKLHTSTNVWLIFGYQLRQQANKLFLSKKRLSIRSAASGCKSTHNKFKFTMVCRGLASVQTQHQKIAKLNHRQTSGSLKRNCSQLEFPTYTES